ncbi:hypothetical protein HYPSUDRAFT_210838 [Hypholoma sublateritium FD-334 SS-4]|uniref:D-lactate dehydratase n=1 Tax=Hypholoma sublateritium (strain FD-334 SS-4) TaxID=945553 RepID=A0A0D2PGP9_HYPSF|nr:hypothetical protein HYPSUDRAFT_210838 [Hypholoma sublateritium FD-334 SS-4]
MSLSNTPSVLFVFTSADKTLTGNQTGWYLPEAAHPYYVLVPHVKIDFAAPKGPNPPVDGGSVEAFAKDEQAQKFLHDDTVRDKFSKATRLSEVDVKKYDAVFYVGGHGPVLDLATDSTNAKLVASFWNAGKIVAAVCHGQAALVSAVDSSGKSIFAGKKATSFTNSEEIAVDKVKEIPFSVEDRIKELGGYFEKAGKLWDSHVTVDGHLITGQNPASATGVGQAILRAIQH